MASSIPALPLFANGGFREYKSNQNSDPVQADGRVGIPCITLATRPSPAGGERPVSDKLPLDLPGKIHLRLDRLELRLIADGIKLPVDSNCLQARFAQPHHPF
jgi:hypothetical protein